MRFLAERGVGFPVGTGVVVPIVPAAILFDLQIGHGNCWPDANSGYAAAFNASDAPVEQGSVGAGTGCTISAFNGLASATKGGIGSASVTLSGGLVIAALIAVNAAGDVYSENGEILAGLRKPSGDGYLSTLEAMRHSVQHPGFRGTNTVIGVVATNAILSKEHTNFVAQMAQDGLARAVRPAHTLNDGDTLFTLATGEVKADVNLVGAFAAEVVAEAIRNGVRMAQTLGGVRAWQDGR